MDLVCHTASGLKVAVEHRRMRSDEMGDGQGAKRDCSTTELRPDMVGATGFEPMTDNPCLRPIKVLAHGHKRKSGQESDCGIARCAESCTTAASDGPDLHRYRRVHENPQSTARWKDDCHVQCLQLSLMKLSFRRAFFHSSDSNLAARNSDT